MNVVQVPTVTALNESCRNLFELSRQLTSESLEVEFDFSDCRFLRPDAVAFLGGLAHLLEHRGFTVGFRWQTLSSAVSANLAQNGFMKAFDGPMAPWAGNSVPYLHHQECNPTAFSTYVQESWLGRGWVGVSPQLLALITSSVGEVYVNAFEHSSCESGIHCCGQYFPRLKILSLTMLDFGVGIPQNVRTHFAASGSAAVYSPKACLEWAFQRGTTTRQERSTGGLGLDNLCEFIKVNEGSMDFYSHNSHGCLRKGLMSFSNCDDYFHGTMVTVRLRCDDRRYMLASELTSLNPFQPL